MVVKEVLIHFIMFVNNNFKSNHGKNGLELRFLKYKG